MYLILTLVREFLIKEFKNNNIPSGYHNLTTVNKDNILTIILKADNDDYSYIKRITLESILINLKEYLLIDKLDINITDNILTININLNIFNEYKIKIRDNYPNVYTIIKGDVEYQSLLNELKMHQLNSIDQDIYNLIVLKDENYYNDLYMNHWNKGLEDIDLSNRNIIKAFSQYLNYDIIHNIVNDKELINFAINNFTFDNGYNNYKLLKKLIINTDIDNIETLIKMFKCFDDKGILCEVIDNGIITDYKWQNLFNILVIWEYTDKIKCLDILLYKIISNNYIYALTILLKYGVNINDNHLLISKELKHDKIYCILCKYIHNE